MWNIIFFVKQFLTFEFWFALKVAVKQARPTLIITKSYISSLPSSNLGRFLEKMNETKKECE